MARSTTTIDLHLIIPNLSHSLWPDTLGTHLVPDLDDAKDIRKVVEQAETDIAVLDQEIARIHEILAHIESRRQEMCRHAEEHRGILAPVRRCPDEILSEIFIHCIPAQNLHVRVTKRKPLLVDQICRRWREVALGTPALWSDVTVMHQERKNDAGRQAEREAEMAQEWLRRAGVGRPISLKLSSSLYSLPADFIGVILPAIWSTSNRWQHLHVQLSQRKANGLSSMIFNSLQSLTLDVSPSPGEPICDVFETAPRLSHVELISGVQWYPLPWVQLTDLSARLNSLDDCLTILSDCPNLVSCVFEGIMRGVDPSSRFRQNLLRHSHLRNLKLETHFNPPVFFDCLATPELRTIHLVDKSNYVFYEAIVNFLLRSSCTIVKLIWDMDVCSIRGVDQVIRVMPELEELEVTRNCGEEFARQFLLNQTLDTNTHKSLCLCPRLHTIRLYSTTGFDIPVLLEFIRSRGMPLHMSSQCASPLRSISLRTRKTFEKELEIEKESLEQLQVFRDAGLDLFIGHIPS
jgi:F-box-like